MLHSDVVALILSHVLRFLERLASLISNPPKLIHSVRPSVCLSLCICICLSLSICLPLTPSVSLSLSVYHSWKTKDPKILQSVDGRCSSLLLTTRLWGMVKETSEWQPPLTNTRECSRIQRKLRRRGSRTKDLTCFVSLSLSLGGLRAPEAPSEIH